MTTRARAIHREALVKLEGASDPLAAGGVQTGELWADLAAGKWSLVDHFERGARWYFVARRNSPARARARALTVRERQAWAHAAAGASNKLIAHTLGLSVPTVATYLARARQKLGGGVKLVVLQSLLTIPPGDDP
jgi:DNA-binding CsgD family transcriptional regulator